MYRFAAVSSNVVNYNIDCRSVTAKKLFNLLFCHSQLEPAWSRTNTGTDNPAANAAEQCTHRYSDQYPEPHRLRLDFFAHQVVAGQGALQQTVSVANHGAENCPHQDARNDQREYSMRL